MKITQKLKEESGYFYVLTKFSPFSPFAKSAIREPKYYFDRDELTKEYDNIEIALNDLKSYFKIMHTLMRFRDMRRTLDRQNENPFDEVELFEIKYFLLVLEDFLSQYKNDFKGIEFIDLSEILNLLDLDNTRISTFSISSKYSEELFKIREEKKQIEEKILIEKTEELLEKRRRIVLIEDEEQLKIRKKLTTSILLAKEDILKNIESLTKIDLILAKAKLAERYSLIRPIILDEKQVIAKDMVNLEVLDNLKEKKLEFTPISINLVSGSTVITGVNMGGKSISLKTMTLNLLLMHTGFFVFAKEFSSQLFESISLILADAQSVDRGLSSFGAEVISINEVLKENKGKNFFLAIDEFSRGTNPLEGTKLCKAICEYFNDLEITAMLTTHFDGVAISGREHYQVKGLKDANNEFTKSSYSVNNLIKIMDYTLEKVDKNAECPKDALKVCALLNIDENILNILKKGY